MRPTVTQALSWASGVACGVLHSTGQLGEGAKTCSRLPVCVLRAPVPLTSLGTGHPEEWVLFSRGDRSVALSLDLKNVEMLPYLVGDNGNTVRFTETGTFTGARAPSDTFPVSHHK